MSAEDYPTIGFNPAPGKLSSIDDLTEKLSKTVSGLKKAHDVLTKIGKSGGQGGGSAWEGEAATAFSKKVGELPKYLDDSHDALSTAEKHLKDWRGKLAEYQKTAREYEAQAKSAKSRQTAAESEHAKAVTAYNSAANDPALGYVGQIYTDQSALAKAQAQYDAAADRLRTAGRNLDTAAGKVEKAREDLEAIIKKAEELLEDHQDYARTIASRLRKANDNAPDTGFFEGIADAFKKLGNKIQEWCAEHADLLKEIGDWLGIASTVLGILALATVWFPPLSGGLALASAGLSAAALVSHGAAKIGGADVSAMDLIGDGLGVIPLGKLGVVAAKGVKVPMKLYKVNGQTVASIDKVNKIRGLQDAGFRSTRLETGLFGRPAAPGSKQFSTEGMGFGDRMSLAWNSHVLDTVGSSGKEKAMSWVVEKIAPQRIKDSLGDAIRADGTLDPNSWWSRGPQMIQQAPGVAIGVYNMFTGSDTPAAGRL
ncbi:putative T7SS-secreted protein [Streptomyces macrosporus]|uniref:Putative T7SS secretion signal domain-containing protein n=1 Tax=Streptomyces macrosporus TaxID=44032 RepID=A0ABP5XMS6_9ACTN